MNSIAFPADWAISVIGLSLIRGTADTVLLKHIYISNILHKNVNKVNDLLDSYLIYSRLKLQNHAKYH